MSKKLSLSERLRIKLLDAREKFLQLPDYEKYDYFSVKVTIKKDKKKDDVALVFLESIAVIESEATIISILSPKEIIAKLPQDVKKVQSFFEHCFNKYGPQVIPLDYNMEWQCYNTQMKLYDYYNLIENSIALNDFFLFSKEVGFRIDERIF